MGQLRDKVAGISSSIEQAFSDLQDELLATRGSIQEQGDRLPAVISDCKDALEERKRKLLAELDQLAKD